MIPPKKYTAIIKEKKQVTKKVTELLLSQLSPTEIIFAAGQFVNLACPGGKYRAYSIPSTQGQSKEIRLLVETLHQGVASNYIRELKIGDQVEFIGPSGRFTLLETLPSHLLFFATGTGIAPFIPMFYHLAKINYNGKIDLFFGVRDESEILDLDKFEQFKKLLANFKYELFVSSPKLSDFNGSTGRVTQRLSTELDKNALYYICGHPSMVDEVQLYLLSLGISKELIKVEGFTHSSN